MQGILPLCPDQQTLRIEIDIELPQCKKIGVWHRDAMRPALGQYVVR
jgi:hypothetical protein